ncbi:hypothetical protein PCASD_08127 [Puccinia coronata f. sp. avenae]|uniref:Uncharacterized protein n=1 Tax=Puccinia coronata f. sp. avenae TaxID=200324 RepID=A0A2N5VA98_9BASI|nr:hypothetical protein PCASD_08127 [Puccinia coronata f. sp. avenae]
MNSTHFFVQLWLLLFIGQHRARMIEGEIQIVFEESKGYRGIPEPRKALQWHEKHFPVPEVECTRTENQELGEWLNRFEPENRKRITVGEIKPATRFLTGAEMKEPGIFQRISTKEEAALKLVNRFKQQDADSKPSEVLKQSMTEVLAMQAELDGESNLERARMLVLLRSLSVVAGLRSEANYRSTLEVENKVYILERWNAHFNRIRTPLNVHIVAFRNLLAGP